MDGKKKIFSMKKSFKKTVLVAVLNNKRDFEILQTQHWYRIPFKSAPRIISENRLNYVAFYQTKIFKEDAFSVKWYSEVSNIEIVKRKDLLPDEKLHPRKDDDYYKINIRELLPLSKSITSKRWRRIIFIETTPSRLKQADEINDLFHESFLEEKFWELCKTNGFDAERQFVVDTDEYTFFLDFALLCKDGKIDIECDGDNFHLARLYQLKRDANRDNTLQSLGWRVLRFSKNDLYQNSCIKRTLDH